MPREEFCKDGKCAKITIIEPGKANKILICKAPPLIVEIGGGKETFSHGMKGAIVQRFDREITGVSVVGKVQYNLKLNGSTDVSTDPLGDCPLPGTYPAVKVKTQLQPLVDSGEITDIYWIGNTLYGYFDARYDSNSGLCTYTVYFGGENPFLKISDKRGILYEASASKAEDLPKYKIECDECCKDTEILCDYHKFPGYKCYPIPPINSQLANNRYDISRLFK